MSDIGKLTPGFFADGHIEQVLVTSEGVTMHFLRYDGERFLMVFKDHLWYCDTGACGTGGTERIEVEDCSAALKQYVWPYLDEHRRMQSAEPSIKYITIYTPYDDNIPGIALIVDESNIIVRKVMLN